MAAENFFKNLIPKLGHATKNLVVFKSLFRTGQYLFKARFFLVTDF